MASDGLHAVCLFKDMILIERELTTMKKSTIQEHHEYSYYTPRKQCPSVRPSMYLVSATPPKRLIGFF